MRTLSFVALAFSTALVAPVHAQYASGPVVQTTGPADQLASVMRRLASAPNDLQALISAGELSVKLDDMSAAAAFFARADKIDPRNGRVKAGMASILVRAERPGEALRFFQQAESYGLDPSRYAADRGLAYDLVGEQERAQRDYRLALRSGRDDETLRRYALSLGISGNQQLALEQLDPLVRQGDRAAWRVRTFVLAMTGDVEGASRIATTMMPAGMAAGLQPFFQRLPGLSAVDRAFAVHFGEVRPTPARLADARLKPALPPLGPDLYAPVRVAAAQPLTPAPVAQPVQSVRRGDRRSGRVQASRVRAASTRTPTVAAAAARPIVPAPVVRSSTLPPQATRVAAAPTIVAARPGIVPQRAPFPPSPSVQVAQSSPSSVQVVQGAPAQPNASRLTQAISAAPVQSASTTSPPAGTAAPPIQIASVAPSVIPRSITPPASSVAPIVPASASVPTPLGATATPSTAPAVAPAPGFSMSLSQPEAPPATNATAAPVPAVRSEDSILARIVASITVPGEELGVAPPARPVVTPGRVETVTDRALATAATKAVEETADRTEAAKTIAAASKTKPAEETAKTTARGRNSKVALVDEDKRAAEADEEAGTKRKSAAEKRLAAAEKKPTKGKAAPKEKPDAARVWVQVAGGASEADLPKAWAAVQKKASALKGREAYTTPLRATNRVVTGPFKDEDEAQAFVNQLARQGVSAFQFTSAAGQKMTKLTTK